MPKTEIDYSNTIIYKITCNDPAVTDVYVGHTTNFVQRKHAHKQNCINAKTANHKCKLYEVMRNNGGWENWKMEIINFYKCHDHYEARQKEHEYFISLHATLNSIEPMPKPKHKNVIATLLTESCSKVAQKFSCQKCDYFTSKKSSIDKHVTTRKHIELTKVNNELTEKLPCRTCSKEFKSRVGLWKHSKTCNDAAHAADDTTDDEDDTPSENMIVSTQKSEHDINQLTCLVIEVVKNNSEFQKQMMDMCKNMQANINMNNCNNNNTTNNFNLQVFLNEYCKDAMNISEFVDSFELELSDLENVGRVGYIEGISNIIINKIKDMDVNKRPIHCSDLKREIIYIKDDNVWEREDANNTKFRKVIKKVTGKNIGMLSGWQERYPECMDIESDYNDIYIKLMQSAMGPTDTEGTETKIMKKVLKHIVIDKKMLL